MEEIWKDIKGYEGLYQVSNLGNIKTLHPRTNGKIMKQHIKRGYYQVGLRRGKERKYFQVHRLIAQAFIPNPNNLPQINHKDENKLNNSIDNLEWCSVSYNNCYGMRLKRVSATNKLKKKVLQFDLKGNFINEFCSLSEASRKTKTNINSILACCKGRYKKANKYVWKYKIGGDAEC